MIRLPQELLLTLCSDSKTKTSLSEVNKRLRALVLPLIKKLTIFPFDCLYAKESIEEIEDTILVDIIRRYPNLETLRFKLQKKGNLFNDSHEPYFENLISYLKNHPHTIKSIKSSTSSGFPNLHNRVLAWITTLNPTKITLESAFQTWDFQSLQNCHALKEISLNYQGSHNPSLLFLEKRSWDLTRLELVGFAPSSDDELNRATKNLKNLLCLRLDLSHIKKDGIDKLAFNCPQLKIFQFASQQLTKDFIEYITKKFPALEMLKMHSSQQMNINISGFAPHCNNLRVLEISNHVKFKISEINALIQYCPHLKALISNHCINLISLKKLSQLVAGLPAIRYIQCNSKDQSQEKIFDTFYQNYPQMKPLPHSDHLSAKQLYKLVKKEKEFLCLNEYQMM